MRIRRVWLCGFVLAITCGAWAQTPQEPTKTEPAKTEPAFKQSKVQSSAEWDKVKSLAGEWLGKMGTYEVSSTYQVVGAGSAVMMLLPGEKPGEEMITMFHPDGKDILVTHYCSAKNQPRMKLAPSSNPNELRFKFLDVTNVGDPAEGHMQEVALIFDGPDNHIQEWTFSSNGKLTTEKFDLRRKK